MRGRLLAFLEDWGGPGGEEGGLGERSGIWGREDSLLEAASRDRGFSWSCPTSTSLPPARFLLGSPQKDYVRGSRRGDPIFQDGIRSAASSLNFSITRLGEWTPKNVIDQKAQLLPKGWAAVATEGNNSLLIMFQRKLGTVTSLAYT